MKKGIVLLCTAFLVTSSFSMAGCSKKSADGSADAKVRFTYGSWPLKQNPEQLAIYEDLKARFMEKNPDIIIDTDEWNYDIDTFLPKAASGQLPTTFGSYYTEVAKLIDSGYIRDITDKMESSGRAAALKKNVLELVTSDGKIYGSPSSSYAMGMFYNRKLFKEAGEVNADGSLKCPNTWEELAQTAKRIQDKTGRNGIALTTGAAGGWYFMSIAWSYGTEFMKQDSNGKWQATFNSDECAAALQYIKDLKWKYKVIGNNNLVDATESLRMFAQGNAAAKIDACSSQALFQAVVNQNMNKDILACAQMPAGPVGRAALMGGWIEFFNNTATDEQVDAAFKWFDFIGKTPDMSDEQKANYEKTVQEKVAAGEIIGGPKFGVYETGNGEQYSREIDEKYRNVDAIAFKNYNEDQSEVIIHPEPPVHSQELYTVFDNLLQAVVSDENADVKALLDTAAKDFQSNYLDKMES